MKISTAKTAKRVIEKHCHGGKGEILFREIFGKKAFKSSLEFFHETNVKPNSTIGYHKHTGNEEIYYIIDGSGIMTVDSEKQEVGPGDAVVTHGGSSHSLINIGKKDLKILVFEAKYTGDV